MANEWYIAKGDKKHGPVSNKGLRELALTGRITPETLIWREGLSEWIPASRIENLFSPAAPSPSTPAKFESAEEAGAAEASASPSAEAPPPNAEWLLDAAHDLPAFPPPPSPASRDQSTERICWGLMLYAKANFGLSLVISVPLVGIGLFLVLAGIVNAISGGVTEKENRMVVGGVTLATVMVIGFLDIAVGLLAFVWLNFFTVACAWGAKVLELLKQHTDARRS